MSYDPPPSGGDDGTSGEVRAYRTLDTARRRRAGALYAVGAGVAGALAVGTGTPLMWATTSGMLAVIATYHVLTAWHIAVTDMDAIGIAADSVDFDFGHGSATLGYRGLLAKPVWEVLLYASGPAPDQQALVTVDALDGSVTGRFSEAVPVP